MFPAFIQYSCNVRNHNRVPNKSNRTWQEKCCNQKYWKVQDLSSIHFSNWDYQTNSSRLWSLSSYLTVKLLTGPFPNTHLFAGGNYVWKSKQAVLDSSKQSLWLCLTSTLKPQQTKPYRAESKHSQDHVPGSPLSPKRCYLNCLPVRDLLHTTHSICSHLNNKVRCQKI